MLIKSGFDARYLTLDDPITLAAAKSSPSPFLGDLPERVALDEVQRAPELLIPIKKSVDENRKPGRFLLTGSANVLTLPKVSESMAGRVEIHAMWPLSQGEIQGVKEKFIDTIFAQQLPKTIKSAAQDALLGKIVTGGYPEVVQQGSPKKRHRWYRSYIMSILQRDIRDLANIEGLSSLPNLLALLASRAGGLVNVSDLARSCGLVHVTLKRYLTLLERVFLVVYLPAWYRNLGKRLIKAPKVYLNDTGLLCHLRNVDEERLRERSYSDGAIFENFVLMEILKQSGWSDIPVSLYHFRSVAGEEVDIVLEATNGRVVGIEIKASGTVQEKDFRGLRALQEAVGKKLFHRGIILHPGKEIVAFDRNLHAVPVSALWEF